MSELLLIIGGLAGLLVIGFAVMMTIQVYNQLVRLSRNVDQSEQNIDVLLKQRQDELTKLIDAAQEMMEYEEDLLTELTEAREHAEDAATPTAAAAADQEVREAMAAFQARVEEYPEISSQQNLQQFQERIADLESQISDRREVYNDVATRYNIRIAQYPHRGLARLMGFTERELFTASEDELEDVDVGAAFGD